MKSNKNLILFCFALLTLSCSRTNASANHRSKHKVQAKSAIHQPVGISNSGNSCYANAVMQILMLMDEAYWQEAERSYLADIKPKHFTKEQQFLSEVLAFSSSWRAGGTTTEKNKRNLRKIIDTGIKNRIYHWQRRFGQEDATEFFQGISQFLGNSTHPVFTLTNTIEFTRAGVQHRTAKTERIASGIDVPLPVAHPELSTTVTLNDMLSAFFATEVLNGENQFEYEDEKYDATKFLRLSGKANHLFVSLKRFYFDDKWQRHKAKTTVDLGDGLVDLSPFIVDGHEDKHDFEVIGVVMHAGLANAGHYTARVKYGDNWFAVNDASVKKTTWDEVKKDGFTQAYFLLLKRKAI